LQLIAANVAAIRCSDAAVSPSPRRAMDSEIAELLDYRSSVPRPTLNRAISSTARKQRDDDLQK
jgi:hypothetical protein